VFNQTKTKIKLLIFCKAPVAGKIKTRLIPSIGKLNAAKLGRRLLSNTLQAINVQALKKLGVVVELWSAPDSKHPFLRQRAAQYQISMFTQRGKNLGERMQSAIRLSLRDAKAVILIGTDCPEMQYTTILQALEGLNAGKDVVLGPALDGGYVLIATKANTPKMFAGIDWGSAAVLVQTVARLKSSGYRVQCLMPLSDLDTKQDYQKFKSMLF